MGSACCDCRSRAEDHARSSRHCRDDGQSYAPSGRYEVPAGHSHARTDGGTGKTRSALADTTFWKIDNDGLDRSVSKGALRQRAVRMLAQILASTVSGRWRTMNVGEFADLKARSSTIGFMETMKSSLEKEAVFDDKVCSTRACFVKPLEDAEVALPPGRWGVVRSPRPRSPPAEFADSDEYHHPRAFRRSISSARSHPRALKQRVLQHKLTVKMLPQCSHRTTRAHQDLPGPQVRLLRLLAFVVHEQICVKGQMIGKTSRRGDAEFIKVLGSKCSCSSWMRLYSIEGWRNHDASRLLPFTP